MRSIQDKVLNEVERILKRASFDPAVHQRWSNTGTVYAQRGFATVFRVQYEFQDDYGSLVFLFSDEKKIMHEIEPTGLPRGRFRIKEHGRGDPHFRYAAEDEVDGVLNCLQQFAFDQQADWETKKGDKS